MKTENKDICSGTLKRGICLFLSAVLSSAILGAENLPRPLPGQVYRLAFSRSMFTDVNEADARASMNVWLMTIAKARGIPLEPDLQILKTVEELAAYCQNHQVDGVGLVTPEFEILRRQIKFELFAAAENQGSLTEEYLLLVRRDSGIDNLEQLKGRSINFLQNPRMSLAELWLDIELAKTRQDRFAGFFGKVSVNNKISQVLLPVFFGKTDACLITRAGFELMGELNPQVRMQLQVIASSPAVVPSGFAILRDYASPYRTPLLQAVEQLGDSPAGRQILTLTQSEKVRHYPLSILDESAALIAEHRRIFGESMIGTADWIPGKSK